MQTARCLGNKAAAILLLWLRCSVCVPHCAADDRDSIDLRTLLSCRFGSPMMGEAVQQSLNMA